MELQQQTKNEEQFLVITDWMLGLELSKVELLVYAIIYGYSNGRDGCFWGSQDKLAKRLHITRQSINSALKALMDKGLIKKLNKVNPYTQSYQFVVTTKRNLDEVSKVEEVKEEVIEDKNIEQGEEISRCQKTRQDEKISPCQKTRQGVSNNLTGGVKKFDTIINNITNNNKKNKEIDISSSQLQNQKSITTEDDDPLKPLSPSVAETMRKFVEYRKAINKPMTSYGITLMVKKLLGNEFKNDLERIKQLETSIINNWQDVFPVNRPQETETNNKQDKAQPSEKNWGWIPQRFVLRAEQLVTSRRWVGALAYLDGMRLVTPPDEREQALIKIEQELQCHEKWEVIA